MLKGGGELARDRAPIGAQTRADGAQELLSASPCAAVSLLRLCQSCGPELCDQDLELQGQLGRQMGPQIQQGDRQAWFCSAGCRVR